LGSAQAKVYGYDWLKHGNPGAEKLDLAVKAVPSNGQRVA
jgi:hypothetical protein